MRGKGFIFYRIFIYGTISFVVFTSFLTFFFQTRYGRELFLRSFNKTLQREKWNLSFEDMGGLLPFVWNLQGVKMTHKEKTLLEAKTVYFRPYLWRILRKELAFHDFWIDKAILYPENFPPPQKGASFEENFSVRLTFKSFKAKELFFSPLKEIPWNISGRLQIGKLFERVKAKIKLYREGFAQSIIEASFYSEKKQETSLQASIQLDQLEAFSPLIPFTFPIKSASKLELNGSWEDFKGFFSPSSPKKALQGKLWGEISCLKFPKPFLLDSYLIAPWNQNLTFTIYNDFSSDISFFSLLNPNFTIEGSAKLQEKGELDTIHLFVKSQDLASSNPFSFPLKGKISLDASMQKKGKKYWLSSILHTQELELGHYPFSKMKWKATSIFSEEKSFSQVEGEAELFDNEWSTSSEIDHTSFCFLHFKDLFISTPFLRLEGELSIQDQKWFLGKNHFSVQDLSRLEPFFPNYPLFGSAEGELTLVKEKNKQQIYIKADAFDLFMSPLHFVQGTFEAKIANLDTKPYLEGHSYLQTVHISGLELDSLSFATNTQGEKWPFFLEIRGEKDIFMKAEGFWLKKPSLLTVDLQGLSGYLFNTPISFVKPVTFTSEPSHLSLTPFKLNLAKASFFCEADLKPQEGSLALKMDQFPMDFLSFNPFDITVEGILSLDLQFVRRKKQNTGSLKAVVEKASLIDLGEKNPLNLEGTFDSHLEGRAFSFAGELFMGQKGKTSLFLNAPMEVQLFPFSYEIPEHSPLFAEFSYQGKVEEVLDYLNFGPHRIKGEADCFIKMDGTKKNPHLEGSLAFQKGLYENYYTGARLEEIKALFEAKKGKLILTKAEGKDLDKGKFSAQGRIDLDITQKFPYWFEAKFSELEMVNIDLVRAKANGSVQVKGDKTRGIAFGNIEVTEADFTIPETLPTFIPSIPITYIHATQHPKVQKVFYETKPAYPLYLKLQVNAPETIFLEGRGLTSEWTGKFAIGGTYNDIQTKGSVKIVRGDFLFAGKKFELNQGLLTFTGKPSDLPYIDLSASLQESGITVIASLRGKINGPHLTFRSLPPLPVSAILSYLIFGQDISEISPLQVAQLAATAASLSGQGPDIFSLTKKKLGIDRLAVVSTSSVEGETVPALQVGKYLAKGILFSVSQGAAPSTSNVSVEVDLTHGFIFQAEALVEQEQGKFSLKWNKNY